MLLGKLQHFGEIRQFTGDDKRRQLLCKKHLNTFISGSFVERSKICKLHLSQYLNTLGIEIFVKSHKLQSGTINIGLANKYIFGIIGQMNTLQMEFINDFFQGNSKFFSHTSSSILLVVRLSRIHIFLLYIIFSLFSSRFENFMRTPSNRKKQRYVRLTVHTSAIREHYPRIFRL